MLQIVQLQDGCYKVVIDYSVDGITIHKEYTFALCESDSPVDETGDKILLELK